MNEVIIFPDAEALFIQYLNTAYISYADYTSPALSAYSLIPASRPARFTRVLRTGGSRAGLVVDRVTFTIESWSDDAEEASEIAQLNRGLAFAIDQSGGVQWYAPQEFAGPANLPDPLSSQFRYTQSISIGVRGSAV